MARQTMRQQNSNAGGTPGGRSTRNGGGTTPQRTSVRGGMTHTPNSTRFYTEMTVAGLLAAFVGSLIVNRLLNEYYVLWPNVVIVAVGMAVMAFLIVLVCGIVESVKMAIADEHGGVSPVRALLCALAAAAVVGGAAAGFEFVYELGYEFVGVSYDDYVFVIDDSGSMYTSDRGNKRYSALEMLVSSMDDTNMVGLVRFSTTVDSEAVPALLDDTQRQNLDQVLAQSVGSGGTDIQVALLRAAELLDSTKREGHSTAVVLLSDGAASVNTAAVAQRYNDLDVDICTVALGFGADRGLLQTLADDTGGMALEVRDADMLRSTYQLLNGGRITRNLLMPRIGSDRGSILHAVMCVVFLAALGVMIGGALILMFNTYYMNTHAMVCVAACSIGALVLELGNDLGWGGIQRTILLLLYGLILIRCGVRGLSSTRLGTIANTRSGQTNEVPTKQSSELKGNGTTGGGRGRMRR